MYIWVYHYTKSWQSALLSGTIYAFLPYRSAHFAAGHLNLSATAWFPFYFLGLYEILRAGQKFKWVYGLVCAMALGLIGLSSMYYLYFTVLMTILFVLGFILFQNRRIFLDIRFWLRAFITALLSVPFLYVALKPFLSLSGQGGLADRSLDYANQYSASPTDFLTPASSHFLVGQWISSVFDRSLWIESSLYFGTIYDFFESFAQSSGGISPNIKI